MSFIHLSTDLSPDLDCNHLAETKMLNNVSCVRRNVLVERATVYFVSRGTFEHFT